MEAPEPYRSDYWRATWHTRRPARFVEAVLAGCAIAIIGFVVGKHQSQVRVLTGVAVVGDKQTAVNVDGTWYGLDTDIQFWRDAQGVAHDGGLPSCLKPGRHPRITFGAVPASMPGGMSWWQVVWVDCRG